MSPYNYIPTESYIMKRILGLSKDTRTELDPTTIDQTTNATTDVSGGGGAATTEGGIPSSSLPESPTNSSQDDETTNTETTTTSVSPPLHKLQITDPTSHPRALKILFLSSDTGGGHRASATSLAQQFQTLFPGSSYALCDIVQLDGPPPYNMLVKSYKHLSAHPQQWKLVYNVSNTRAYEMLADVHMKSAMERSVRRRIQSYDPDVVVSVHPLMTNVPVLACRNIAEDTGRHLPIFTVCTDLGSAHSMWFANGVEKLFVASDAIRELAMQRGKVPLEKIVMSGLPIRHDFAVQAIKMGERHGEEGRVYQKFVREELLGLGEYSTRKTVLVMGGGEGCGRLSNIVDALYLQFVERGMEALILVVCGRNDALVESLANRDWDGLRNKYVLARTSGADFDSCVGLLSDVGCIDGGGGVANQLRRIISSPSMTPFVSDARAAVAFANDDRNAPGGESMSLPNSRSGSPTRLEGREEEDDDDDGDHPGDNVEVLTRSCAQRNNLYDLNSLLQPCDTNDEDATGLMTIKNPIIEAASAASSNEDECSRHDNSLVDAPVKVLGLGFITNMAEYMTAADVLVTKAGPGTIAEAASLSLPVMLTSFLPGQEEGNVDFVIEGNFGTFVSDADPQGISDVVAGWLSDEDKLKELSDNAQKRGAPDAAADIVAAIGESALKWKTIDESHHTEVIEVEGEDGGGGSKG